MGRDLTEVMLSIAGTVDLICLYKFYNCRVFFLSREHCFDEKNETHLEQQSGSYVISSLQQQALKHPSSKPIFYSEFTQYTHILVATFMKKFFNIAYILTVAHDTAAFVFTPQSSCISNCRIYNEKCRVQSPSLNTNLFALNEKKNENDKLVEGEETNFVDALKSALQEVWMLKDDEEVS